MPKLGALALLFVVGAGCGPVAEHTRRDLSAEPRIDVVATIGMAGDAAARVGGERVAVESLMGPGVDPHLYKASEGDVRRLEAADVIVYGGLHLESKMADVLERIGDERIVVAASERIPPADRLAAGAGTWDPHVWFDVRLWMHAVRAVGDTLAAADRAHAAGYRRNLDAYLVELRGLDAYVRRRAAEVPRDRRVIVTAHDAFSYFGRAYGFEVIGLQGISTAAEAGARDVQELARLIARRRIPAIFVESSVSPRTIRAVREAVRSRGFDVRIGGALFSDAMGDAGTPEGTYVGMVRHNVDTLVEGLKG